MTAADLAPPLSEGASDGWLIRTVRWRDYQTSALGLRDQIARITDSLHWHEIEAGVIVNLSEDGAGILPYIADLSLANVIAERIFEAKTVERPGQDDIAARIRELSTNTHLRLRR